MQGMIALLAVLVDASAPFLTGWIHIPQGVEGSYSSAWFIQRIMTTSPDSFRWIERKEIFPFGLGLGGVGNAQNLISSVAYRFPDNLFLFLLSTFGLSAIVQFLCVAWAAYRGMQYPSTRMSCALSVLTFILIYGMFVSFIEDQMEALFLGASLGALFSVESQTTMRSRTVSRIDLRRRTKPLPGSTHVT